MLWLEDCSPVSGLAEVIIRSKGGEACGNGKVSRGQGTSADGRMVVAGVWDGRLECGGGYVWTLVTSRVGKRSPSSHLVFFSLSS